MDSNNRDPVREYLTSVVEARMEIKRLQHKVAQLEAQATKTTNVLTGMPRGGGSDRDKVLATLADLTSDYCRRIAEAEKRERDVDLFIQSIPSRDSRLILRLRYIEGFGWRKVLTALGKYGIHITERQMFRLHGKALQEARERFEWR